MSPVSPKPNATALIRKALAGSGVELVASCSVEAYDTLAPEAFRSEAWLPGARGLVVVGSAGPAFWRRFRDDMEEDEAQRNEANPLDRFVGRTLAHGDGALKAAGIRFFRFDAVFDATPRVDFVALGRLVGLGYPGPFGMLIHPEHGPWWALRGAWVVDAYVDPPLFEGPACTGCPAPCVGGWANAGGIAAATMEVRSRCIIGREARYDDDQIAYHRDWAAAVVRLRPAAR